MHQETKEGSRARLNACCAPSHRLRRWIGTGGLLLSLALAGCQSEGTTSPADAELTPELAPEVVTEEGAAAGPDFALASTTTVKPWRDETFATYTSDTHWRSDPHGWMPTAPTWFNQGAIHIDRSVTYDGHPTLRYDWPAPPYGDASAWCNSGLTREAGYYLPQVLEVWIEVVHKFAPTFNTNHWTNPGGRCGVAQWKFLLMWRKSGDRFGLTNGVNGWEWWSTSPGAVTQTAPAGKCGAGWNCALGYGNGQSQYLPNVPKGPLWDGQWHVYRAHIKLPAVKGEKTGVYELWIDGKLVRRVTGQTFIRSDGGWSNRLDFIGLGSNSNSGISRATNDWWGRLRMWTSNPGW